MWAITPIIIPDNPFGREMMARQVARQFCRLREVHSLVYGRRASGESGRKLTADTRVGSESRLMDYLGLLCGVAEARYRNRANGVIIQAVSHANADRLLECNPIHPFQFLRHTA